jgi:hypothetical protein
MKPMPTSEAAFETVIKAHLLGSGYKALSGEGSSPGRNGRGVKAGLRRG